MVGLTVEPKVLALVQEQFPGDFPHLERIQEVLEEVPKGPTGPLGPFELAALSRTLLPGNSPASAQPTSVLTSAIAQRWEQTRGRVDRPGQLCIHRRRGFAPAGRVKRSGAGGA